MTGTMVGLPLRMRPTILLFGDSITQQGFGWDGGVGWISLLSAAYSRRADVLNRGFSGYNTRHAVEIAPKIFAEEKNSNVLFCTVFFGANDAALPGERQHVPIEEYADNLGKIVIGIRESLHGISDSSTKNDNATCPDNESVPILLLTPPPVDIDAWLASRGKDDVTSYRANDVARDYGSKVKQVASEFNCSVLDVFELLGGNNDVSTYGTALRDGLHLSEEGNKLLYSGLMDFVTHNFPDLAPMCDGNGKYGKTGIPLQGKLWSELC